MNFFASVSTLYDGDQELIYKFFASNRKVNRISQNYLMFVGRCDCVGEVKMPTRAPLPDSIKALHFSGHVIDFETATLHGRQEEPCVKENFGLWRGCYDRMRDTVDRTLEHEYSYDYNEATVRS